MVVISRMPVSDISRVRGIGVADMVSTSTAVRMRFEIFLVFHAESLFLVDDHQPQVLEPDGLLQQPVGADHDVHAAVGDPGQHLVDVGVAWVNRESSLMVTGNWFIRPVKVWMCWCASRVVGTSTATCLPSCTALNAARTATSVLP